MGDDSQLLRVKGVAPATPTTLLETKAVAADPVRPRSSSARRCSAAARASRSWRATACARARAAPRLYRGTGKKIRRVKTLDRGTRRDGKPYRVKIPSRGRNRGTYTIRLRVTPSDGSARRIYKLVARKL